MVIDAGMTEFYDVPTRGVDFGLLDRGVTALVEWNNGFALGSHGLYISIYTELIIAQWYELTCCTATSPLSL